MSNIIQKIAARAKQIRKAKPSIAWQAAIKQASKELKGSKPGSTAKKSGRIPKKKAAKKSANRQTGVSNNKRDKQRVAKAPGKRLSKTGKVYYERRKNRSDKPGALSGISAASLKTALRTRLEERLGKAFVSHTKATTKRAKKAIQKTITSIKAELKKLK